MNLSELERLKEIRILQRASVDKHEQDQLEAEREEIVRKIRLIPHRHRVILELYYDKLLTWKEVSEAMQLDLRYIYRIRKELIYDKE